MRRDRTHACWILLALAILPAPAPAQEGGAGPQPRPGARTVLGASEEAESAIRQFKVPPGFKVELFAAEPRVANISSFDIAPSGKVYAVEVFRRRGGGVLDLRNLSAGWLEDDLSSRTVADRVAMVKRRLAPQDVRAMEVESDRVRLVEDRDSDGRADHDSVFATGFNRLEDGTAAGVLALRDGSVLFANIPSLWLLRDADHDGKADVRKALHTGFGVHYEISGHDLHGLRMGPDGRVYFSIGDRGLHVVTPDGKTISNPDSGAVLRCEPDGSNLELVHTGLRNPQDLAFDEHGNLFTGDNNSDGGDATRWVYVVEGGDSGWRVGYQWQTFPVSRGPWNFEQLWKVSPPVPAHYRLPPLANPDIPGPAGLTYTGVVGLPPEWRNRFLLVDFRGGASNSGVWALANKPKGASFELAETEKLVWNTLATDVEVGYDGGVYFSDWINGWVPLGKGRIYRAVHPEAARDPAVAEVRSLLAAGLSGRPAAELAPLLSLGDMRVRTAAQFALVDMDGADALAKIAGDDQSDRLARLHAVWGLGQLARRPGSGIAAARLLPLLDDVDVEVRAQAAKVLGEARCQEAFNKLCALLDHESARVTFFAASAVGRLGRREAVAPLFRMLEANRNRDAYLRHAGVAALASIGDVAALARTKDGSPPVRLAALLALRRLGRAEVGTFLRDPDAQLVLEAARAINDEPIDAAAPQLAALLADPPPSVGARASGRSALADMVLSRALNANFRLATPVAASAVAVFAARDDISDSLRIEALRMLGDWAKPSARDRITGVYHPRNAGDPKAAADALAPVLGTILRTAPDAVRAAAAKLVPVVGLDDVDVLVDVVKNTKFSGEARAAALGALFSQKPPLLAGVVDSVLSDRDPVVRRQAVRMSATLPDGPARLRNVLESGNPRDQQAAFEAVGSLPPAGSEELLTGALDRLVAGKLAPEPRLDLLTAAANHTSPRVAEKLRQYESLRPKDDPLAGFREALAGGDREMGRAIFAERTDVQCLRCHAVKGEGGSAGPDLSRIGERQTREYLLESILFPAKHIAQGFETVTVRLDNGDTVAGVLKSEDARHVVLVDPEKGDVKIEKARITARRGGQTAMPPDIAQTLSKHDLRDLVEFLAGLK